MHLDPAIRDGLDELGVLIMFVFDQSLVDEPLLVGFMAPIHDTIIVWGNGIDKMLEDIFDREHTTRGGYMMILPLQSADRVTPARPLGSRLFAAPC
jgi:hypothetical protein